MNNYLILIKMVNDNYNHITELDTLRQMFGNLKPSIWLTEEEIEDLKIVCTTTQNSHYTSPGVYTHEMYQNPDNHVDMRLFDKEPTDSQLTIKN